MKIHIATDHAGFELKQFLMTKLSEQGHLVVDHGAFEYDLNDDYPEFCFPLGDAVVSENIDNDGSKQYNSLGIVIGGSGNGEQIAVNKVKGVRAALGWNVEIAKLARQHNNANIIAIGARMHSDDDALKIVSEFINTGFSEEPRHTRRIKLITDYERSEQLR